MYIARYVGPTMRNFISTVVIVDENEDKALKQLSDYFGDFDFDWSGEGDDSILEYLCESVDHVKKIEYDIKKPGIYYNQEELDNLYPISELGNCLQEGIAYAIKNEVWK